MAMMAWCPRPDAGGFDDLTVHPCSFCGRNWTKMSFYCCDEHGQIHGWAPIPGPAMPSSDSCQLPEDEVINPVPEHRRGPYTATIVGEDD